MWERVKTCKYKKCFDQSLIYCPIFGNQDCILDFEGHYECQIFMIDENFQKRPFKVNSMITHLIDSTSKNDY